MAAVLVSALFLVALTTTPAPAAAAESNATITASPNDPGATATHRATAVVQSESAGDSLNKFRLDYTAGTHPADVSNVGQNDVVKVGLDTDGDGAIDKDVSSDLDSVSASNDGHTLSFGFGGSYNLHEGDRFVVVFENAGNPDAEGTFDVNATLNYQSNPVHTYTTGLTIDGTDGSAAISADPNTDGSTANHSVDRTVGTANNGTDLTTLEVNYSTASTPADVSNVTADDVTQAGLDTDGDGILEVDLLPKLTGVTVDDGGETVTIEFDGSETLATNDTVHVAFGNVTNPAEAGDYSVEVRLDSSRTAPPTATLSITAQSETANASVTASPTDPNTTATHTATGTVGSNSDGDSLNGFTVDYTAGSQPTDVSNVGQDDVKRVGLDTDGDGEIETNVSDDLSEVSVSNDGHTVTFGFGGSYSLAKGDRIVVEYANAGNPDAEGTFDVDVVINPQSTGDAYTTGLTVENTSDDSDGTTDGSGDGPTTVDPSADVEPEPATANATATHRIEAVVGSVDAGASLDAFTVDYPVERGTTELTDVGLGDVRVGIDTDGDGRVETSLTDALTAVRITTDGRIHLSFDGSYTLTEAETVVVTVANVHNPDAGDHEVAVEINPTAADSAVTTTLSTVPPDPTRDDAVENALLVADPPAAGANATHTARITAAEDLTLDRVTVGYPNAVGLGDVDESALVRFGVDADGDGEIDRRLRAYVGSVSTLDGAVRITLREDRQLAAGETLVVALSEVRNPDLGTHEATVRLNDRSAATTPLLIGSEDARTSRFQTDGGNRTIVQYPDDETVVVDLSELQRNGVTLQRVRIQPANDASQIVVGTGGETYERVDARGRRLAQLPVDHNDVAVANATVTFTVAKSRLAGTTYGPENVSLYHRENGGWTRADTELVGETGERYRFRATAESLSTYVVRTEPPNPRQRPAIGVAELSLSDPDVVAGERSTVHAIVRNAGNASGSRTVSLTANGVVIDTRTVSLAPDESAAVTFEHAFSRPGTYDVTVGDRSFSVQVEAADESTSPTATPTTSGSDTVPGFGASSTLVALTVALGALLARRRHN
ncbi:PGF-pre-PGF domain-containing protein [Haloparvum sp. AD34]